MKRLAAIATVAALFALPVCAQRGGSHGGFSGPHGGAVSAPRSGFSGGHSGFGAAPRPPSIHGGLGGVVRGGPPRFSGFPGAPRGFSPRPSPIRPPARFAGPVPVQGARPPQYISHRMPYPGLGATPRAPASTPFRQLNGTSHRMPYHPPNGGDHRGGWDHRGHDGNHWHGHGGVHVGFYSWYGWAGYPYWPWWGWGYPFLNGWWDYPDNYDHDAQPASNYAPSQYPEYTPDAYDQQYEPWPYSQPAPDSAQPAPDSSQPASAPAPIPEVPVTLVFTDGRPDEQIHNYLLTSKTLSVLDRNRRDIPVNQIDVAATEGANRKAGVNFALPIGGGK